MTRCCTLLILVGLFALACAPERAADDDTLDDALWLYEQSSFKRAKKIAAEYLDEPLGRLVYHLCQVHDPKHRDTARGLSGLKSLYDDSDVRDEHRAVWAEAGLGYARVVQLFQIRRMHREYADVDADAIYRDIIAGVPKGRRACTAVIYLAEGYLRSEDRDTEDAGFRLVEDFLAGYAGDARNTVPVRILIEGYYINLRDDYAKSCAHLLRAYELGIAKEMLKRETLFRLGRMCQVKLNRPADARRHYRTFLRLFPEAERTPVVKRYLTALDRESRP